ncbi:MAG: transaldolase [Gemmatimonadetes bacterium]|nr:transaldolase [Gemmatimonadota bacterium]
MDNGNGRASAGAPALDSTNPLVRLTLLGQSPWLDYITRDLLVSGDLERMIEQDGLRGMTTNPTIFEKAVAESDLYDADIRRLTDEGQSPPQVFEALAVADVQKACDIFRGVYDRTHVQDGYVSIEVSPTLAYDAEGTVREARRLWGAVARPNSMIKIPGTAEGLSAIEKCLALGININVTLLFAVSRYERVIAAYFAGQQQRLVRNMPLDRLASVASFFVSRVDGKIDPMLDKIGTPEAKALKGTIALANAQVAYERFEHAFRGSDWRVLARKGARPQRPLWASTSTKNPAYQDTIYVEGLIAPHTVNTLPPETMNAYRDHGSPAVRIPEQIPEARARLEQLAVVGVDLAAVTEALEKEGVEKFAQSYAQLLTVVEKKAAQLTGV